MIFVPIVRVYWKVRILVLDFERVKWDLKNKVYDSHWFQSQWLCFFEETDI